MMAPEIAASLITAVSVLAGTYVGASLQRDIKRQGKLEARIERYKAEIRARQAEEQAACAWLVEAGLADSERSALLALRQRTETAHGKRPRLVPSEMV